MDFRGIGAAGAAGLVLLEPAGPFYTGLDIFEDARERIAKQSHEVLPFMDVHDSANHERSQQAPGRRRRRALFSLPCSPADRAGTPPWSAARAPGLLIDVGIGPRVLGERLESVGASWSLIAAAVLTHTHSDHVDTATFAELARRGVLASLSRSASRRAGRRRGVSEARRGRADQVLRRSAVLDVDGPPSRADRAAARRWPDVRFSDRGAGPDADSRPVSVGYLADTGSWSEAMVESLADVDVLGVEFNHDVAMQRRRRTSRLPDRAKLERRRASLESPGSRA